MRDYGMNDQERLDRATDALAEIIKGLDRIGKEAAKEASARCRAGDNHTSADLRDIEADLREAAAHAARAYAKGRRLVVPGGDGGIVAYAGGS